MSEAEFDVVVVGGGFAGLCCAGTLIHQGGNVALVAETPDVGWNLRPKIVEGNHGFIQFPVWQVAWGGGWWYQLARALNVPCQFEIVPTIDLIQRGSAAGPRELTFSASAAGLAQVLGELSPIPLEPDARADLERVLAEVLGMDWRDLVALSDEPLSDWVARRDLHPLVQALLYVFAGNMLMSTPDQGAAQSSVFGVFAPLRAFGCGEIQMTAIKPDVRTGFLLPLAETFERHGGTVLRGKKVAEVLMEHGRAVGVALRDGSQVRAKAVALATGTSRVPDILPDLPDDVAKAVGYAAAVHHEDVCIYAVLDDPVVPLRHYALVHDEAGANLMFLSPQHALAPWSTKPGKQFIVAQSYMTPEAMTAAGGEAEVAKRMVALIDELFPGFANSMSAMETQRHRHLHNIAHTHGPKLPRTSADLPGLFFVGDGSAPVVGMGIEAAAGAGVLGGRDIIDFLEKGSPNGGC